MIYTIATLGKEPRPRCVGYFESEAQARHILQGNYGGLDEDGYYTLAVIEEVKPGLYPCCRKVAWFRYENRWMECPEPESEKHICNYAIG